MSEIEIRPDWIAVDWGTTRLRAFAMTSGGEVLAKAASGDGMAALEPDGFEAALLSLIAPWLESRRTLVLAAGMVGAKQGWVEAPYRPAPVKPNEATTYVRAPAKDPRIDMRIAPGVSQSAPPDVMRGEETQIAGHLADDPNFDGVLCLPGTHTKWARISAGEIVGFKSFMTGELFALLSERSVLRHSIGEGWDEEAFLAAVEDGLSKPETVSSRLFGLRAADLLEGADPDACRARLSGLLIGIELAGAKAWWLGSRVAIIGSEGAARPYRSALAGEGVDAAIASAERATLSGLAAARLQMENAP